MTQEAVIKDQEANASSVNLEEQSSNEPISWEDHQKVLKELEVRTAENSLNQGAKDRAEAANLKLAEQHKTVTKEYSDLKTKVLSENGKEAAVELEQAVNKMKADFDTEYEKDLSDIKLSRLLNTIQEVATAKGVDAGKLTVNVQKWDTADSIKIGLIADTMQPKAAESVEDTKASSDIAKITTGDHNGGGSVIEKNRKQIADEMFNEPGKVM